MDGDIKNGPISDKFAILSVSLSDMVRNIRILLILTVCGMLWACGDDDRFRVEGVVDGLGTRGLQLMYESGNGLHTETIQAIDGKFSAEGASKDYTLAHLTTTDGRLIARMLVRNGHTLKCVFDVDNPYNIQVKGNKPTEEWAKFLRENHEQLRSSDHAGANRLILDYVDSHKGDIQSAALMLTQYYAVDGESRADSIFALISPEARPDALVSAYRRMVSRLNTAAIEEKVRSFNLYNAQGKHENFYPGRASYSMLYFSGAPGERRDMVTPVMHRLVDSLPKRRIRVVEISMAPDTAVWKRNWRADTTAWAQVWVPGGPANPTFAPLDIPRLPYLILCDSLGVQVYRGSDISAAVDSLRRRIHARNI